MSSETFSLENFCRACMNSEGTGDDTKDNRRKTISIFNEPDIKEYENITIMELLLLTTPQLNIESGDMLPKTICENCLERLINAYEFQQMCIRVDEKFRLMIKEGQPANTQIVTDPLNDNAAAVTQAINDLTNILKIEMDEPLIDPNESNFSNKEIIGETADVKFETNINRWEDDSSNGSDNNDELFGDVDSDKDSDWESPKIVTKR